MRYFEVVANHDVWDVLDGDQVVGVHRRKPEAVWQAIAAARSNAPARLSVIAADGHIENITDFQTSRTTTSRPPFGVPSADR
ncbi:hypothetical protein ACFQZ4_37055 [Catellatospora coxensis]|uniref:DUF2188 domain-containing protein n=1 Tax=Catellatospora coxensis TaxID=310354 RepID=A0A8J3P4X0_9ACTN|nr:hypothetical protein [Catellatospora coxensis]GIG03797.1 hypothetical protein Cco03nite_04970 [Catellatospora coxensis]